MSAINKLGQRLAAAASGPNGFNFGLAFVIANAVAILIDLYMVLVLGTDSISYRVWVAEREHPTILTAGVLATVGVAYLVRESPVCLFFAAFMGGHLFAHW